jgi:hypothetical protein
MTHTSRAAGCATRRQFIGLLGAFGFAGVAAPSLAGPASWHQPADPALDVYEQVTPSAGVRTSIAFNDSIAKLVAAGAFDPQKYRGYGGPLPAWVERTFTSSDDSIVFSRETARHLLILLWALGLANKAAFNAKSPIATVSIPGFASTGGWSLGRQDNGYVYFNSVEAVSLTERQQDLVLQVATRTYRPCCDNSTFFQDCNHGSAMLGLLQLAASQGATAGDLYRTALAANAYWFPANYAKTALYFAHFHLVTWRELDPSLILGRKFSSGSGWSRNVDQPLRRAGVALPGLSGGAQGC